MTRAGRTTSEYWDRVFERMCKEEEIRCPHCQYLLEGEETCDFISYYGEEGAQEMDCPHCDKLFWVEELVRRTYEVTISDPYKEATDTS